MWGPGRKELDTIAARAGCRVTATSELPGGRRAYDVSCRSGPARVRLLVELARADAMTPQVRRIAEAVAGAVGGGERETAAALHKLVRDGVRFARERRETFSPTMWTLAIGIGDCDDSARALAALLWSIGYRVRFATLGDPATHVAAQVKLAGRWHWAETTLAAQLGEHPIAAARRLRAARGDI